MKKKILLTMCVVAIIGGGLGWNSMWAMAEDGEPGGSMVLPELYIKAVNPGYNVDGVGNTGEMIEIGRRVEADVGRETDVGADKGDGGVGLFGVRIDYTNSSGNSTTLIEFPEGAWMTGETMLLRLASAPGSEFANETYAKTLAFKAGPLEIKRGDEVIDTVCWTGKDGCTSEFKSANPTTLVRTESGEWEHREVYEPVFLSENYEVRVQEGADEDSGKTEVDGGNVSVCKGVVFSEILSYYEETRDEQFVELYNTQAEQVRLDGCSLKYKNKLYPLTGIVPAEGYLVRRVTDFALTKNPTSANLLELVDGDGAIIDRLEYPNGQRKGAAYAMIGYDSAGEEIWKVTYASTPGEPNNYQEFQSCASGKVINEATGNCVKVTEITEKVCAEGQYLNILTGRCNKIEETKVTECKEGYYLNPETGRCKKIVENSGTEYAVVPETYEEGTSFVAAYAVAGIIGVGLVYLIWEFRHEISRLAGRVFRIFHS